MSEKKDFVTCPCRYCNGLIEFDASLFQTGTTTNCPHCGMETALFIPKIPVKAIDKIPEKTAKLIEQKEKAHYYGGMEDTLENVGGIFLFLGVLGGIAAIIMAIVAFNSDHDETGIGVDLLCVGFISILAGAVNRIFLRAGAEIIRLLKKISGLKFSGEITQPVTSDSSSYKCSDCGASAFSWSEKCASCGAKFEK